MELIHIITTHWNQESKLKEFISWYRNRIPSCKITVWDNQSDSKEVHKICAESDVDLIEFSTSGKMAEEILMNIRNRAWLEGAENYKYFLVVDLDEFAEINEKWLLEQENKDWDVCKFEGWEMFGQFHGVQADGYSKPVLFKGNHIISMNFEAGSHNAAPYGLQEVKWLDKKVKLYHTKWQDFQEGFFRQKQIEYKGISDHSKERGWNFHYSLPLEDHLTYFGTGCKNAIFLEDKFNNHFLFDVEPKVFKIATDNNILKYKKEQNLQ